MSAERTEISPNEDIKNNPNINLLFVSTIERAFARVHIHFIPFRYSNQYSKWKTFFIFLLSFFLSPSHAGSYLYERFYRDIIDDRERRRYGRRMYEMAQVARWNNFFFE